MKRSLLMLLFVAIGSWAWAQTGSVSGRVVDADTGEGLIGANVILKGTTTGATTDVDGNFEIGSLQAGNVTFVISYVGYQETEITVHIRDGQTTNAGRIKLEGSAIGLQEIQVIASFAEDRKTPVAVSTIKAAKIEESVGNQEFPEVLRFTPSIYTTKQGGGFGDARINVRGFDQRNTAVMINGIPVNDMENGWVYWSNWAGLSDVSSAIQVQRGLSATKLAVSSVGGTINIITKTSEVKKGGSAYSSVGNDGYLKFGLSYNTGLTESGWAFSVQGTRTQGNGYIDGTQFSAWSYFASLSKTIGDKHTLVLTGLGAPQWHHQRNWSSFDNITLRTFKEDRDLKYNDLWGTLDGEEFSWRRNFYHKPKVFLNHYFEISEKTSWNTSAYLSFGNGGGTGPRGRGNLPDGTRLYDSNSAWRNADGQVRWDDIKDWQTNSPSSGFESEWGTTSNDASYGNYTTSSGNGMIRRASMNNHTWMGILSTFDTDLSNNLNLSVGFDGRYYKGEHFRRLENLIGLSAYESRSNDNNPSNFLTTEDAAEFGNFRTDPNDGNVLAYWNDGLVRWLGLFSQLEYSNDELSAFVALSGSNQGYKRIDYFGYLDSDPDRESDWESIMGGTVKAGANYNINANHNVYAYGGYLSRQPLFDAVYINFANDVNPEYENEKITSFELGYGYTSRFLGLKANFYYTNWGNRFIDQSLENPNNPSEDILYSFVVDQAHRGFELEALAQPIEKLEIRAMTSIGSWTYPGDYESISGANVDNPSDNTVYTETLELKDQKIGDAAQTQLSLGASYEIFDGFNFRADYIYFDNLYARWSATDDLSQGILELPEYGLLDLGFSYFIVTNENFKIQLRGNMNNVLDTEYISEMYTNRPGDILDNEGFYGFGRTWNATLKVVF